MTRLVFGLRNSANALLVVAEPVPQHKLVQASGEAEKELNAGTLTVDGVFFLFLQYYWEGKGRNADEPAPAPAPAQVVMHVFPERTAGPPSGDAAAEQGRACPGGGRYRRKPRHQDRGAPYSQKGKENQAQGPGHRGGPQSAKNRNGGPPTQEQQPPATGLRALVREQSAEIKELKDLVTKLVGHSADNQSVAFHVREDHDSDEDDEPPRHVPRGYKKVNHTAFLATLAARGSEGDRDIEVDA